MKSAEAFKRTFGGGSLRIDVADGFIFDPNKHSAATIVIADAADTGALEMDLAAMTNGDTFRLIFNKEVTLTGKAGQTMYPTRFTGFGIVEFEMVDGYVYAASGDPAGLVATKIVVGTTPSVCTTKAKHVFGGAANHLKVEALSAGTRGNGWRLDEQASSVSMLAASIIVDKPNKRIILRYETNASVKPVSITAASLASLLNLGDASAYVVATVSGTAPKFDFKGAGDCKKFSGTLVGGENNGTVAAMGKIYIASGFGALHVCVSTTDGSQLSNASYFKSVSLA